jgi:predicted transcriptional regulator
VAGIRRLGPELSAILVLAEERSLNQGQLIRKADIPSSSIAKVIQNLVDLKLATHDQEDREGAAKPAVIELTALGRRVAKHVHAIDELLVE